MTARLRLLLIPILGFSLLVLIACKDRKITIPKDPEGYQLVWSDEFDYEGLPDSKKWSYDVGDACDLPCGCGWGNNELQWSFRNTSKDRTEPRNLGSHMDATYT